MLVTPSGMVTLDTASDGDGRQPRAVGKHGRTHFTVKDSGGCQARTAIKRQVANGGDAFGNGDGL